jgi:hypothetical protein
MKPGAKTANLVDILRLLERQAKFSAIYTLSMGKAWFSKLLNRTLMAAPFVSGASFVPVIQDSD